MCSSRKPPAKMDVFGSHTTRPRACVMCFSALCDLTNTSVKSNTSLCLPHGFDPFFELVGHRGRVNTWPLKLGETSVKYQPPFSDGTLDSFPPTDLTCTAGWRHRTPRCDWCCSEQSDRCCGPWWVSHPFSQESSFHRRDLSPQHKPTLLQLF